MKYFYKIGICTAILLSTFVTIWALWLLARTEYYFRTPSIMDNQVPLPAFSAVFFEHYRSMWIVVVAVCAWSAILVLRKNTKLEDILMLSAYAMLATAICASATLYALYLCNQDLVFRL